MQLMHYMFIVSLLVKRVEEHYLKVIHIRRGNAARPIITTPQSYSPATAILATTPGTSAGTRLDNVSIVRCWDSMVSVSLAICSNTSRDIVTVLPWRVGDGFGDAYLLPSPVLSHSMLMPKALQMSPITLSPRLLFPVSIDE